MITRNSAATLSFLLWLAVFAAGPVAAQDGATLAIQPAGTNEVLITWPAGTNFNVLQTIPALSPFEGWLDVPDAPAAFGAHYGLYRDATEGESYFRLTSRGIPGQPTPPDPAVNPPPLAPNTFNDMASSTAFLYNGSNAVQIGVAPGTIVPARAAVLRGKVKQRDNAPLPGVRVAVLDHPEYGYTFSRQDGLFDLAVNGGPCTVDFQAIGYCPAQRQVEAPLQDFRTLKDVVLVPVDALATAVTFGSDAPPQLASGSPQTDASGPRTTRVFFPAGTTASLALPDGSSQPAEELTLRITEVTVGTNGPAAMPALLPPTSAYTFCADFGADEAAVVGARSIQFNQPLWSYVDNFIGMPVGTLVPNGYYDRERAAWVPQENGLVIRILGVSDGLAQVDLTGGGVAADSGTLATNQFSSAELQHLAATYAPGSALWRMPLTHFSFIDWNAALPTNNLAKPYTQPGLPLKNDCDKCPPKYGTANFTSQVFEEAVPLVGVPMALHYSSARVPDYRELAQALVPLLPTTLPDGILGVSVRSEIAGVAKDLPYALTAGSSALVSWDGYDAYGRFVGGSRDANIEVDYYYPITYALTPSSGSAVLPLFGNFGQTNSTVGRAGGNLMTSATFTRTLTIPDHRGLGLGGWSLTPHHRYDPVQRTLYLGDGTVLQPERLGNGVQRLLDHDAVPGLKSPGLMTTGPDGTLFFLSNFTNSHPRIYRRSPDGQYTFLTGPPGEPGILSLGSQLAAADGQSALKSDAGIWAQTMKAGPDGSLYLRCPSLAAILRIDPQGILHVVLGYGPNAYPPDGTFARAAYCVATHGTFGSLAIASDGTVYYDDRWYLEGKPYNFIRKVAPDGRIYTLMGQAGPLIPAGTWMEDWREVVGGPARSTRLNPVVDLAWGPDGSLYVSPVIPYPYQGGVFKITPGGQTAVVLAGIPIPKTGHQDYAPGVVPPWDGDEGEIAVSFTNSVSTTGASATGMQVGSDGSLIFQNVWTVSESDLWRITPNGIIQRLAGRGRYASTYQTNSDPAALTALQGGNPLDTWFQGIGTFGVGPDNRITLIDASVMGILQIASSLSGFTGQELQIPSQDAREVYVFDAWGNHLRTLNGLTGSIIWSFSYDANNLVTDIRDANGLVTHIERNGAGQPSAIVGPYGQRTTLALDGNGFLSAVINPVGEATVLTHTTGGLLMSITGPLGDADTVTYDALGLVTRIRDPLGGGYDMARSDLGTQIDIRSATTLANVDTRTLSLQPSGDSVITATYADGTASSSTLSQGGGQSVSHSDGTMVNSDMAGDPRFPQATRLPAYERTLLPGGLEAAFSAQRSVVLLDTSNPFSVAGMTNLLALNGQSWKTTYNGTNRVWTVTSPEGRQGVTGLDGQGRVNHHQTPGHAPIDVRYDLEGHVSEIDDTASVGLRRITFDYDSLGRLRTLTDPLGHTLQYSYDDVGRLQQLTLADGQVASFKSDAEFHLISVAPPGRPAHRFFYSAVGQVTNYVPPIVNGLDESVHCAYDADRNLTQVALPDGQNVVFTLGPGGRIDHLVLGSGPTLTYTYAPNHGLPTTVVSTTGDNLQFGYQGSCTTNTTWSGTITGSVSRTLNADFLPASQSVNGAPIAYTYDRDLLLTQAGNLSVSRDPATGLITGTSLGSVTDQRQFDGRGLLTNYVARVSGTSFWSVALAYDLIDRLTNKVETVGGTTRILRYAYDGAGRLQQVWQNGALAATYTYDANGNRLTRNAETATYDAQDRVQTYADSTFGWSRNGDLQTRTSGGQTTTYTYDAGGALTAVVPAVGQRVDYLLDAIGRRIGKKVGGALQRGWLWDEDLPIAELASNSAVALRFVYAADDLTPSFLMKGTNTYRLFSDERGSVRFVVNVADGSIAQELDYDEFGRVLKDTGPGFQPFGYAGGLCDPDTGLVHFGARDYVAETGQWTARDPLVFSSGQWSLYAYAQNDPINLVDPDGNAPERGKKGRPPRHLPPVSTRLDANFETESDLFSFGVAGQKVEVTLGQDFKGRATVQGKVKCAGVAYKAKVTLKRNSLGMKVGSRLAAFTVPAGVFAAKAYQLPAWVGTVGGTAAAYGTTYLGVWIGEGGAEILKAQGADAYIGGDAVFGPYRSR